MCGIFGVIGHNSAAQDVYQGLLLLQHRGQDSAGIISYDFAGKRYTEKKGLGYVSKVFNEKDITENLQGQMSVGHTRYSTIGEIDARDIQPIITGIPFGIGIAHNGNILNTHELTKFITEKNKRYLFTNNDIELILNMISHRLLNNQNKSFYDLGDFIRAVQEVFTKAQGGYSVLCTVADHGILAFKDPYGIRPLCFGEKKIGPKIAYAFSSESNALEFLGYSNIREMHPGEVIYITQAGEFFSEKLSHKTQKFCMFEYIYFSNPETVLGNQSVYRTRLTLGKVLAGQIRRHHPSDWPDVIVPVPDTSRVSALSLSEELKIPYRELLVKNRYVQRSFILNTQESRTKAVEMKLTALKDEIIGKHIMLVDDSVVRGTTSKQIVKMIRAAGASQITLVSSCPKIKYACHYGIAFPTNAELVAYERTHEQIREQIGADQLIYLDLENLPKALPNKNLCTGCLNNEYPIFNEVVCTQI